MNLYADEIAARERQQDFLREAERHRMVNVLEERRRARRQVLADRLSEFLWSIIGWREVFAHNIREGGDAIDT